MKQDKITIIAILEAGIIIVLLFALVGAQSSQNQAVIIKEDNGFAPPPSNGTYIDIKSLTVKDASCNVTINVDSSWRGISVRIKAIEPSPSVSYRLVNPYGNVSGPAMGVLYDHSELGGSYFLDWTTNNSGVWRIEFDVHGGSVRCLVQEIAFD